MDKTLNFPISNQQPYENSKFYFYILISNFNNNNKTLNAKNYPGL